MPPPNDLSQATSEKNRFEKTRRTHLKRAKTLLWKDVSMILRLTNTFRVLIYWVKHSFVQLVCIEENTSFEKKTLQGFTFSRRFFEIHSLTLIYSLASGCFMWFHHRLFGFLFVLPWIWFKNLLEKQKLDVTTVTDYSSFHKVNEKFKPSKKFLALFFSPFLCYSKQFVGKVSACLFFPRLAGSPAISQEGPRTHLIITIELWRDRSC